MGAGFFVHPAFPGKVISTVANECSVMLSAYTIHMMTLIALPIPSVSFYRDGMVAEEPKQLWGVGGISADPPNPRHPR